jgi:hypothetical protein
VLKAFHEVHGRRINNRLKFLFGFNRDDFTAEILQKNGFCLSDKTGRKSGKEWKYIIDMKEINLRIPLL